MSTEAYWIRNGYLCDPAAGREGFFDLYTEDGVIRKIVPGSGAAAAGGPAASFKPAGVPDGTYKVIDAAGQVILPGLIDLHVHFRDPGLTYKETIQTGTMAAAHGGFTTVVPMPNTKPPIDSIEHLNTLLELIRNEAVIHVIPVGSVTVGMAGAQVVDLEAMAALGMKAVSEDGKSVMNSGVYAEAMRRAKACGVCVLAHCEDINLVRGGVMNAGRRAEELGLPGITNAVEDIITARDIYLAAETGVRLHLCHCSTAESVRLVRNAKEAGIDVSAEVCPHHFTLCEDDIPSDNGMYKMNPPLRSAADREALLSGLADGTMETIATDHAPHASYEKEGSMRKAAFGITGLETAFAVSYTELVKSGRMQLGTLVTRMSTAPARILGLPKGTLTEGSAADLMIADLNTPYEIRPEEFFSKGKNTPFGGRRVYGKVRLTMSDGVIVYQE